MKGNLLLLLSLLCGIGLGAADATLGECIRHYALPTCLLALLVLQVGIGLGSNGDLGALLRSFRWQMLLLPVFTIVGTLSFTALAALLFRDWSVGDILAMGSGFGYYSLSSVMIADLKSATAGAEVATQLAAVALRANMVREVVALFGSSFFNGKGGRFAPISVAGINSMDVCLPTILRTTGDKGLLPLAVIHGIVLEISVPLLITLFC